MNKNGLSYMARYIKEGLSYFTSLPLHLTLFGLGVSAAVFLFLIWQKQRRKEKLKIKALVPLAALILYLVFVLIITTLSRTPFSDRMHNLHPLHTLTEIMAGSRYALKMAVINLALLLPLGFLCPFALEFRCGFRDILFLAFLVSVSVECTQYLFRLGLMETDDVLNNCLGALAGYILALIMNRFISGKKDRPEEDE